ncbi:hypothetical protein ABT095_21660 [Kitasatospora sp. NPDC002227]|uniref:anti-sigma factor family protein n=1 Tax=Kitasatospora sp. NPDC002227 TaxID=3154773 RepID=UPI00332F815E
MTPHASDPRPTDGHPELEQLADLAEELTDPAEAPALREHLRACPECADSYAALLEVRELLGAEPAPPLPTAVADRIDAALAAEAAARQELTPREAPAPEARPRPAEAPARPATALPEPAAPVHRPRRRRRLLVASLGLAAALALGTLISRIDLSGPSEPSGSPAAAGAAARPGVTFTEGALPQQIRSLLPAGAKASPGAVHGMASAQEPNATTVPAPCQAAATGHPADTAVLLSTPGSYQGAPVQALVYPLPEQPGQLDVYLVTPSCPGSTVLLHTTVPSGS